MKVGWLVILGFVFVAGAPGGSRAAGCPPQRGLEALGFPGGFAAERGATRFHAVTRDGRSWIRARTDGDGTLGRVRSAKPHPKGVDLRGHFLKLRLRLDGPGRLGGMEFRVGSGGPWDDYYLFEIPLFTDPLFDPLQAGEWLSLTLSFGRAKVVGNPDRTKIRWVSWAVRDDGTAPLAVDWADLGAVPEPEQGIVSFTFDDGYDEHLQIAARAMARHRFPGTAYVMPDQIGDAGYLSLEELRTLQSLGWDVAAHHDTPLPDFDDATLEPTLVGVRDYLLENGFSAGAGHLAYPLGRHDPARIVPTTRRVFATARIAGAGPETLPPADRYRMRAINVLGGATTPDDLRAIAEGAIEHRHWAVLMFHYLVPGEATTELEYSGADFERAVDLIRQTGVPVRTVNEVWQEWQCDVQALDDPARPKHALPASR